VFYVNKIVGWTLSPLGIFFLGLFAGLLLRRWGKWRTCGNAVIVLVSAMLWTLSCGFSTRWVGLPLEGEEIDALTLPKADAIVLLGGGMGVHEKCGRPEMFQGADRVWAAAKLWKAGKAPLLTLSGGWAEGEIALLSDMGVATNGIVVLESARNTEEEAALIAKAIKEVKAGGQGQAEASKILLVTSAWHMPRAKMLFERAGFEVIAAPTDYEMHFASESLYEFRDFFPYAEVLELNSYAVKEWVARACYWLKGRCGK